MKILIQMLALLAAPLAAYAVPADFVNVPEPETFSLLGIGAVALALTTLSKKK